MKNIVKIIKIYQYKKRKLILETTDIDLIPDNLKLTEEAIEKNIDKILNNFKTSSVLSEVNCLHCNIYFDNKCKDCPYDCAKANSLYQKTVKKLLKVKSTKLNDFYKRLYRISYELKLKIEEYKNEPI